MKYSEVDCNLPQQDTSEELAPPVTVHALGMRPMFLYTNLHQELRNPHPRLHHIQ